MTNCALGNTWEWVLVNPEPSIAKFEGHGIAAVIHGEIVHRGVLDVVRGDGGEVAGLMTLISTNSGWNWGNEQWILVHSPQICREGRAIGLS